MDFISDNTPWKDLESHQIGWDISLKSKEKFINAANEVIKMDNKDMQNYKEHIKLYIEAKLKIEETKNKYVRLFNEISISN